MAELPNAPIKRLLSEGGHGCRVSAPALDLAAVHVSNIVHLLGHTAGQYAMADGRKTIMDHDISRAWGELTA
jgi:histone H3/H4